MSSRRGHIGEGSGRLIQRVLLVLSALLVFSFASTSHAYPWMIRHGYAKCESCHTDPMGGETLTAFGRVISDTTLSTRWGETEPSSKAELLGVAEPRELRVGGSFRYMDFLYEIPQKGQTSKVQTFPMQLDTYGQLTLFDKLKVGGSLGGSRVPAGSPYAVAAQITKNNAGDQWNLISRTHWLGFDVTDDVMVRAGRLNLPFGIRMPEHTMWVRSETRTDRESAQQHGVAVDYSKGRWRGELMGIAGNYQLSPDKFRERGYSLYAEYLLDPHAAIGVSSLVTHAADDRFLANGIPLTRQAHGLTGRYAPVQQVALLAEADVLLSSEAAAGYVGMLQGDYEFAQGFHAILTGEILDNGRPNGTSTSAPGLGKPKIGGWVTFAWFFFTHFDARIDFFAHTNEPSTVLSQIHYYF